MLSIIGLMLILIIIGLTLIVPYTNTLSSIKKLNDQTDTENNYIGITEIHVISLHDSGTIDEPVISLNPEHTKV